MSKSKAVRTETFTVPHSQGPMTGTRTIVGTNSMTQTIAWDGHEKEDPMPYTRHKTQEMDFAAGNILCELIREFGQ